MSSPNAETPQKVCVWLVPPLVIASMVEPPEEAKSFGEAEDLPYERTGLPAPRQGSQPRNSACALPVQTFTDIPLGISCRVSSRNDRDNSEMTRGLCASSASRCWLSDVTESET